MNVFLRAVLLILLTQVCHGQMPATVEPPGVLRDMIEEHGVSVRLWDSQAGTEFELGSGLIVGDDGEKLIIATAEHVVEAARSEGSTLRVEVRFVGRDAWSEARLTPKLEGAGVDLAAIEVDRNKSPFDRRLRARSLAIAPPPPSGDRLWVYALNRRAKQLTWQTAWQGSTEGATISFDCEAVEPGCSGGVVLTGAGIVGMVQSAGIRGRNHQAHMYGDVLEKLGAAGVAVQMRVNTAIVALRYARERRLTGALHVTDFSKPDQVASFWAGLHLTEGGGDEFAGEFVTGAGRTAVTFASDGPATLMKLPKDCGWPIRQGTPKVPSGVHRFEPAGDVSIPGFVILRGSIDKRNAWLAIPMEPCEFVASRLLVGAAGTHSAKADIPRDNEAAMRNQSSTDVGGRPRPFTTAHTTRFNGFALLLPEQLHRDAPVRITGLARIADTLTNNRNVRSDLLKDVGITIESVTDDAPLADAPLARNEPIELRFAPPKGSIRIGLRSNPRLPMRSPEYFLIDSMVIRYGGP